MRLYKGFALYNTQRLKTRTDFSMVNIAFSFKTITLDKQEKHWLYQANLSI